MKRRDFIKLVGVALCSGVGSNMGLFPKREVDPAAVTLTLYGGTKYVNGVWKGDGHPFKTLPLLTGHARTEMMYERANMGGGRVEDWESHFHFKWDPVDVDKSCCVEMVRLGMPGLRHWDQWHRRNASQTCCRGDTLLVSWEYDSGIC